MTTSEIQPPAQQPAAPYVDEQKKSGVKKWAGLAGTVVVAGGVGAYYFFGGAGAPEVGDCVRTVGETEFEVVDCSGDEAQFTVVGIDDQEMTYADFEAAPAEDFCGDFATTEMILWAGELVTEPGTIYCAAAV